MAIEEQQRRLLNWEGCLNARDLGGYPTRDGGETRWGAIVRADTPSLLTAAGQQALLDHGIRTIVDLRTAEEVSQHPNPFAEPGPHGVIYHNVSFIDPSVGIGERAETMAEGYQREVDRYPGSIGRIMTLIAEAPEGGVLVHCMGGRDRTGIISALLLDVAGVPRDIIAEDYALSSECLRPRDEAWLENGPGERAERERELERSWTRAEVMLALLDHIDRRYGGTEAYLREAGVSPEDIARLRSRLADRQ